MDEQITIYLYNKVLLNNKKINEPLTSTTAYINFKIIILSKRIQVKKYISLVYFILVCEILEKPNILYSDKKQSLVTYR